MTDSKQTCKCFGCGGEHVRGTPCPVDIERARRLDAFGQWRPHYRQHEWFSFVLMQTADNRFQEWLEKHEGLNAIYLSTGPYISLKNPQADVSRMAAE